MTVYTFPPVGLRGFPVWRPEAPTRRSVSIFGRRYITAHDPRRIYAEFSASARHGRKGIGYMEALRRLLDGGVNYVRLFNKIPTAVTAERPEAVRWYGNGAPVRWTDAGAALDWYTGTPGTGTPTTQDGYPAVHVTGLPANSLICIPGEIVRIGETVGGEQRMALNEVTSDGAGEATIRVDEAFTVAAGTVIVGDVETGIFEVTGWPSGGGPIDSDFSYDWRFRQVFEDEDPSGTATELSPWY